VAECDVSDKDRRFQAQYFKPVQVSERFNAGYLQTETFALRLSYSVG